MTAKEKEKNMFLDSDELILHLAYLASDNEYKKKSPPPKFHIQEARFIRDLIFNKPKGLLFFYLADYLMNETIAHKIPMFNAPSMRKLRFIHNFIGSNSAKEAAIKAGYSPKTARQQASRTLREIHGYKRLK